LIFSAGRRGEQDRRPAGQTVINVFIIWIGERLFAGDLRLLGIARTLGTALLLGCLVGVGHGPGPKSRF
jgi:hypothetical protein